MKFLFSNSKYLLFIFFLFLDSELKADNYYLENKSEQHSELLIESNKQKSDLKNSIFYAEGEVIITNTEKEFIARSQKAIFYKLIGKIKLIGNAEVTTSDSNKIQAGEILYYLKENRFEAISDQSQRVNTKFVIDESKIFNQSSN